MSVECATLDVSASSPGPKARRRRIAIGLSTALLAAAIAAVSCRGPLEGTVKADLKVGDRDRTYYVHVPKTLTKPAPLVLMFHGGGADALSAETTGNWSALSDRDGFIVAYPEAIARNWNDGRGAGGIASQQGAVDDVGFALALIDALAARHDVDPNRIYATGISNGAMLSHTLALRAGTRLAAIAPVVGGLPEPLRDGFAPPSPVAVLVVQGTLDPLVPFDGGDIARGNRGRVIPTREAVALWVRANGCAAEPTREELPDKDPTDGCRVSRTTWSGGTAGTEVTLLEVVGGGHTWPDGRQYLPERWIGKVCRDIDTDTIWRFMQAHPKRPVAK